MTDAGFSEEDVARFRRRRRPLLERERGGVEPGSPRGSRHRARVLNNPAFLEFAGDLRGKQVLDAGCGEGHNTRILARRGARLTGVDISERMIGLALAEERRAPLGIQYVRTSYTDLGVFPPGRFDAVISFMALMDGPRFDLAMRESFRVLRPGGLLVFSITHPCFITKGGRWLRNEDGVKVKWMISEYSCSGRSKNRGRLKSTAGSIPVSAAGAITPRCSCTSAPKSRRSLGERPATTIGTARKARESTPGRTRRRWRPASARRRMTRR